MTRTRVAAIAAAAVALLGLAWIAWPNRDAAGGPDEREWKPLHRTVTVEVWNGGGVPGAARDAALRLRRGGLDVVSWENAPEAQRDSVPGPARILVRLGDTTGAGRIAEVLGSVEIVEAPDPTRLVDLTVVVMRDST